ncbi:CGNR zinc finger domain-containing protein [Sphingomonas sp. PAMC26645]|uniref:CGNR zinc finger domain-containing protein n=1 Tax=Sphingomonas sp. PAMC26645 TaxID=2565555 RepID=UPI00109DFDF8|nr:CGNR zinc finger domain-containing protein [Sphingomonas sp. PAMC26645]QCB43293.1 CGNR zinc finger domain-containing protein [Sphingomonas sp. PAMC26645]
MRYLLYVFTGNIKGTGMPEHREGTPTELRDLESFLWCDFDTTAAWRKWSEQRRFDSHAAEASFKEAGEVQRALRQLEASNNGITASADVSKAMTTLNHAIEQHALRPRITADGVRMHAGPGDAVGHVLQIAIQAMTTCAWPRFKLCRDPACRASFFDASKNGSKIWCSMELCGSRNKMRRHRGKAAPPTQDVV